MPASISHLGYRDRHSPGPYILVKAMTHPARRVRTMHPPTTGPDDPSRVDRLPRFRRTGRTRVLVVSACLILLAFLLEPRTSAVVAELLLLVGVVCGFLVIRGAWRTWHKPLGSVSVGDAFLGALALRWWHFTTTAGELHSPRATYLTATP